MGVTRDKQMYIGSDLKTQNIDNGVSSVFRDPEFQKLMRDDIQQAYKKLGEVAPVITSECIREAKERIDNGETPAEAYIKVFPTKGSFANDLAKLQPLDVYAAIFSSTDILPDAFSELGIDPKSISWDNIDVLSDGVNSWIVRIEAQDKTISCTVSADDHKYTISCNDKKETVDVSDHPLVETKDKIISTVTEEVDKVNKFLENDDGKNIVDSLNKMLEQKQELAESIDAKVSASNKYAHLSHNNVFKQYHTLGLMKTAYANNLPLNGKMVAKAEIFVETLRFLNGLNLTNIIAGALEIALFSLEGITDADSYIEKSHRFEKTATIEGAMQTLNDDLAKEYHIVNGDIDQLENHFLPLEVYSSEREFTDKNGNEIKETVSITSDGSIEATQNGRSVDRPSRVYGQYYNNICKAQNSDGKDRTDKALIVENRVIVLIRDNDKEAKTEVTKHDGTPITKHDGKPITVQPVIGFIAIDTKNDKVDCYKLNDKTVEHISGANPLEKTDIESIRNTIEKNIFTPVSDKEISEITDKVVLTNIVKQTSIEQSDLNEIKALKDRFDDLSYKDDLSVDQKAVIEKIETGTETIVSRKIDDETDGAIKNRLDSVISIIGKDFDVTSEIQDIDNIEKNHEQQEVTIPEGSNDETTIPDRSGSAVVEEISDKEDKKEFRTIFTDSLGAIPDSQTKTDIDKILQSSDSQESKLRQIYHTADISSDLPPQTIQDIKTLVQIEAKELNISLDQPESDPIDSFLDREIDVDTLLNNIEIKYDIVNTDGNSYDIKITDCSYEGIISAINDSAGKDTANIFQIKHSDMTVIEISGDAIDKKISIALDKLVSKIETASDQEKAKIADAVCRIGTKMDCTTLTIEAFKDKAEKVSDKDKVEMVVNVAYDMVITQFDEYESIDKDNKQDIEKVSNDIAAAAADIVGTVIEVDKQAVTSKLAESIQSAVSQDSETVDTKQSLKDAFKEAFKDSLENAGYHWKDVEKSEDDTGQTDVASDADKTENELPDFEVGQEPNEDDEQSSNEVDPKEDN